MVMSMAGTKGSIQFSRIQRVMAICRWQVDLYAVNRACRIESGGAGSYHGRSAAGPQSGGIDG
jgi:hypothetical protein